MKPLRHYLATTFTRAAACMPVPPFCSLPICRSTCPLSYALFCRHTYYHSILSGGDRSLNTNTLPTTYLCYFLLPAACYVEGSLHAHTHSFAVVVLRGGVSYAPPDCRAPCPFTFPAYLLSLVSLGPLPTTLPHHTCQRSLWFVGWFWIYALCASSACLPATAAEFSLKHLLTYPMSLPSLSVPSPSIFWDFSHPHV